MGNYISTGKVAVYSCGCKTDLHRNTAQGFAIPPMPACYRHACPLIEVRWKTAADLPRPQGGSDE